MSVGLITRQSIRSALANEITADLVKQNFLKKKGENFFFFSHF